MFIFSLCSLSVFADAAPTCPMWQTETSLISTTTEKIQTRWEGWRTTGAAGGGHLTVSGLTEWSPHEDVPHIHYRSLLEHHAIVSKMYANLKCIPITNPSVFVLFLEQLREDGNQPNIPRGPSRPLTHSQHPTVCAPRHQLYSNFFVYNSSMWWCLTSSVK